MGCDIHAYIQVKDREKAFWRAVKVYTADSDGCINLATIPYTRDYELFGWLTGGCVRADVDTAMDSPRGIPDELAEPIQKELDWWGNDAHSISYATVQELEFAWQKLPKKVKEYNFETDEYEKVKNQLRIRVSDFIRDCRTIAGMDYGFWGDDSQIMVVFWFDN